MNRRALSILSYAYRLSPSRRVSVHMKIMADPDMKRKATKPRNSRRQHNKLPLSNSKTRYGFSSNVVSIYAQNELEMVNRNDLWQGLYLARPILSMAMQRHILQSRSPSLSNHNTPSSMHIKTKIDAAQFVQDDEKEKDRFSDFLYYGWDFCEKLLPVLDNMQRKFTRDHSHSSLLAFRAFVRPNLGGTYTHNLTAIAQDQTHVIYTMLL
ncbi:hypothetical protein NQZ79_g6304 [Umbelopsis isabellina]|nr:hypothetical protein NQZ79_g6304 [Umbelopsis isabellina]